MSPDSPSPLSESTLASETLAQGSFLQVRRDTVRLQDGSTATREYLVHPGAVVIVPLLADGRLVMERQFRYPVRRVMLEFPAGKLDAGEDPLACGQRELLEETGYSATEWAYGGEIHLAISYSTEVLHVYFARGLSAGERRLDEGEFLDVLTMDEADFFAACADGRVTDAKTLACALRLDLLRSGRLRPEWRAA